MNSPSHSCVSDLQFDRLLAGELAASESETIYARAGACSHCQSRLDELRADVRAFPMVAPRLSTSGSLPLWRQWHLLSAVSAAAAAAVLLVVLSPSPSGLPDLTRETDVVRVKGAAPVLNFIVKRGADVRLGAAGEVLHPRDQLRFQYSASEPRYITIVSVDGAGTRSVYFPADATPFRAAAGSEITLPGAIELDDTLGRESLFGFFCEKPHSPSDLEAQLPSPPADCTVSPLSIEKAPLAR